MDGGVHKPVGWGPAARRARTIGDTILGVVFGAAGGVVVGLAMQSTALGAIGGAIGGGVVGYLVGEHRSLEIRFTAQLALCQVAIEENTRPLRTGVASASAPAGLAMDATGGSPRAEAPATVERATVDVAPSRMALPPGPWETLTAPRPGRYDVVTCDPAESSITYSIGRAVALEARTGGTWIQFALESGKLFSSDSYRWAVSVEQAGMLLLMDTADRPVALLRWTDER